MDEIKPVPAEPRSPDEAGDATPGASGDTRVVDPKVLQQITRDFAAL